MTHSAKSESGPETPEDAGSPVSPAAPHANGSLRPLRAILPWLLRLLGPALLLLFLLNSNLEQLFSMLLNAALWPILLSLLLLPPFIFFKVLRWRYILRQLGLDLPLRTGIGLYIVGIFLGATTPGQAGDLVKAWYLQERGQPLAPAMLSVVLDRLCDLLVMAAVATLGIFALGQLLPNPALRMLLVVGMSSSILIATVMLVARGPRQWLLIRALPAVLPARLCVALTRWNNQFTSLALHPRLLLTLAGTSLVSAFFTFFRLWLLFIALDVYVPLYLVVGSSALIAVLQVLPISIAGVGVRDAVLIATLTPLGYSQEQALGVSALFLLITLEHILVGFIVSLWYPLGQFKQQAITRETREEISAAN
jgi:glycosyltransferase 2 family protein